MPGRFVVLCGAALFAAGTVFAQDYPNRPVRIVVGYAPAGATDILARLLGQWLSERLGRQFVIENRPGAANNIGTEAVARAPADGYTLLLVNPANAINATLYDRLNYNFLRDIAPVAGLIRFPNVMEVNLSVPVKTVPEFIAYAKANPGKINMASSGNATPVHVGGELFQQMAGVKLVHVPYRGEPVARPDLLSGQVQMLFADTPILLAHIKSGKFRALAVAAKERVPSVPDVPTMGELGLASVDAENWYGMVGPAGLPKDIVAKLHKAAADALKDPGVLEKLSSQGAKLIGDAPDHFGAFIKSEIDKWAKVVKASGAKQTL